MKFGICVFFEKSFEKIQFLLKSDANNGYFVRTPKYIFWLYLTQFVLEREIIRTKFFKKSKHVLCPVFF